MRPPSGKPITFLASPTSVLLEGALRFGGNGSGTGASRNWPPRPSRRSTRPDVAFGALSWPTATKPSPDETTPEMTLNSGKQRTPSLSPQAARAVPACNSSPAAAQRPNSGLKILSARNKIVILDTNIEVSIHRRSTSFGLFEVPSTGATLAFLPGFSTIKVANARSFTPKTGVGDRMERKAALGRSYLRWPRTNTGLPTQSATRRDRSLAGIKQLRRR